MEKILKQIETGKSNNTSTALYTFGHYMIKRSETTLDENDTWVRFNIGTNENSRDYLPRIYFEDHFLDKNEKPYFKIQTTSYGAVKPEEIDKIIEGLREAQELVGILTETFLPEE